MSENKSIGLPKSLKFLENEIDKDQSNEVVIARISDEDRDGFAGHQQLLTALIPINEVDEILSASPRILEHEIKSWGPLPIVDRDEIYSSNFYVRGRNNKEYEALVHTWSNHNKTVVIPDNVLLMCYGLAPRLLDSGDMCWDDPSKPVYGVLRVHPVSTFNFPKHSGALVRIRRDYLEDYLSLKNSAAVAVYYEERLSLDDPEFDEILNGRMETELSVPGQTIVLARVEKQYFRGCNQFARVWGCSLILSPQKRPILGAEEPALIWPDYEKPISSESIHSLQGPFNFIYVTDNALEYFEDGEEFDVSPESGNVGFGGQWGTSYNCRVGRNHIRVELRKLYEGNPNHVIEHFHKFSIPFARVKEERRLYGDKNIGMRVREFFESYLLMINGLVTLSRILGLDYTTKDMGGYSEEKINYSGLWSDKAIRKLANVVPVQLSRDSFFKRCFDIYKCLEGLKPAPLREMLLRIGVKRKEIRSLGPIRLLAILLQLSVLARENGYTFAQDSELILDAYNQQNHLEELGPLFALNELRNFEGHIPRDDSSRRVKEALSTFGIDVEDTKNGWGTSLDAVYEALTRCFNFVAVTLLRGQEPS